MGKIMKEGIQYGVGGTQKASEITYGSGTVADALGSLESKFVSWQNITSGASTPIGSVTEMSYVKAGNMYYLHCSLTGITLAANTNLWVQVPDSFPGNATFFAPLSSTYSGVVAVYRTQSGVSGKFILIQSPTALSNAPLNIGGATL